MLAAEASAALMQEGGGRYCGGEVGGTGAGGPSMLGSSLADEVLRVSGILAQEGVAKDGGSYSFPLEDEEGLSQFELSRDDMFHLIGLLNSSEVDIAKRELSVLLNRLDRQAVEGLTQRLFYALRNHSCEIAALEYEASRTAALRAGGARKGGAQPAQGARQQQPQRQQPRRGELAAGGEAAEVLQTPRQQPGGGRLGGELWAANARTPQEMRRQRGRTRSPELPGSPRDGVPSIGVTPPPEAQGYAGVGATPPAGRSPKTPGDGPLPQVFRRLTAPPSGGPPVDEDASGRLSLGGEGDATPQASAYLEALLEAHELETGQPATLYRKQLGEDAEVLRRGGQRVPEEKAKEIFDRLYKSGKEHRVRRRVYHELGLLVEQVREAQTCPFEPIMQRSSAGPLENVRREGNVTERLYRDGLERRRRREEMSQMSLNAPAFPFRPQMSVGGVSARRVNESRDSQGMQTPVYGGDEGGTGADYEASGGLVFQPGGSGVSDRLFREHADRKARQYQRQEMQAEWRKHSYRPDISSSQASGPHVRSGPLPMMRNYSMAGLPQAEPHLQHSVGMAEEYPVDEREQEEELEMEQLEEEVVVVAGEDEMEQAVPSGVATAEKALTPAASTASSCVGSSLAAAAAAATASSVAVMSRGSTEVGDEGLDGGQVIGVSCVTPGEDSMRTPLEALSEASAGCPPGAITPASSGLPEAQGGASSPGSFVPQAQAAPQRGAATPSVPPGVVGTQPGASGGSTPVGGCSAAVATHPAAAAAVAGTGGAPVGVMVGPSVAGYPQSTPRGAYGETRQQPLAPTGGAPGETRPLDPMPAGAAAQAAAAQAAAAAAAAAAAVAQVAAGPPAEAVGPPTPGRGQCLPSGAISPGPSLVAPLQLQHLQGVAQQAPSTVVSTTDSDWWQRSGGMGAEMDGHTAGSAVLVHVNVSRQVSAVTHHSNICVTPASSVSPPMRHFSSRISLEPDASREVVVAYQATSSMTPSPSGPIHAPPGRSYSGRIGGGAQSRSPSGGRSPMVPEPPVQVVALQPVSPRGVPTSPGTSVAMQPRRRESTGASLSMQPAALAPQPAAVTGCASPAMGGALRSPRVPGPPPQILTTVTAGNGAQSSSAVPRAGAPGSITVATTVSVAAPQPLSQTPTPGTSAQAHPGMVVGTATHTLQSAASTPRLLPAVPGSPRVPERWPIAPAQHVGMQLSQVPSTGAVPVSTITPGAVIAPGVAVAPGVAAQRWVVGR